MRTTLHIGWVKISSTYTTVLYKRFPVALKAMYLMILILNRPIKLLLVLTSGLTRFGGFIAPVALHKPTVTLPITM